MGRHSKDKPNGNQKYTGKDVLRWRELIRQGWTQKRIAEEENISVKTIGLLFTKDAAGELI